MLTFRAKTGLRMLVSAFSMIRIVIEKYSDIKLNYQSASMAEKRKMIVSIYPKNLCFDGVGHRTPYINEYCFVYCR